jgi:enoyl-CoA hydratase
MTVHVARYDAVVALTLDRPAKRNAVDHATLVELLDAQATIASDRSIRVVVLTGASQAFSAGADLDGIEEGRFTADLASVLRGFGVLDVPVIAAIDGPALGAGAQLAVASDLRIATANSVIGVPAAKLGLVVDHWTVRRLVSEFTPPVARAMLVAAETYTAQRLYDLGGIHRLGTLADALDWAAHLAQLAPLTMAGHKIALEHLAPEPHLVDAVEAARRAAWASADAVEGRTAFLARRRPDFTGS